jgi:outer membrane protein OmpA-like peptidoglycan-associated protein
MWLTAQREGWTVTRARVWWVVAALAVPACLAALALVWAGPSEPPGARADASPAPRADAVAAAPPGALPATPTQAVVPDPMPGRLAEVLAARPIRFAADSAELTGPSADAVRRVAELIAADPVSRVLVEGYVADTPGGQDEVQRLSDERAAVVAQALVAAGVPAERITARGLGAGRPLATVEESRRVEITLE